MRKILFAAILALGTMMVNAQAGIGIKAGATISNMSGDISDNEARVSYQAGVKANIPAGEKFFVSPEILLMNVGPKINSHLSLTYTNLSVLFAYAIISNLYLSTGPSLGLLMNAKYKYDGGDEDIKDQFNSTSFAWVLALEYLFKNGFGLGAQYNFGLSNIHKNEGGTLKNQVFAISLMYLFMLNKK